MNEWGQSLKDDRLPDSLVVFLAGAFVGLAMGPRVVSTFRGIANERAGELTSLVVEHFMGALKEGMNAKGASIPSNAKRAGG